MLLLRNYPQRWFEYFEPWLHLCHFEPYDDWVMKLNLRFSLRFFHQKVDPLIGLKCMMSNNRNFGCLYMIPRNLLINFWWKLIPLEYQSLYLPFLPWSILCLWFSFSLQRGASLELSTFTFPRWWFVAFISKFLSTSSSS